MNYQQRTPYPCVRVVYIAGDTLRHQPMGASHMTMLQLRGPMGSCVLPWWLFIAGDTLCHQPMGTGHMTVLQLCGLMEFRALQWCHPMLASTRRTSCCTRIITLYGTRKWIQARTLRVLVKDTAFLAELFRGMLFKWKGENKKSHQKWDLIVNLRPWLAEYRVTWPSSGEF